MCDIQVKLRPSHVFLLFVLVNLAEVCSARQKFQGAVGEHERIPTAPFGAKSSAESSHVPRQVSQGKIRISFYERATDIRDAFSARGDTHPNGEGNIWPIRHLRSEDHVPHASRRGSAAALSPPRTPPQVATRVPRRGAHRSRRNSQHFPAPLRLSSSALNSRTQLPADVLPAPSESAGSGDRNTPTNPHWSGLGPGAGQVRRAQGVLTGHEGQQHILSHGGDAVRGDPYDVFPAAFPSRSLYTHSRQHLSSLTARDNVANLLPGAVSEHTSHFGRLAEIDAKNSEPRHVGRVVSTPYTMGRETFGGSQHVGQSQITLMTHHQGVQPGPGFAKINSKEFQSHSHARIRQPDQSEAEEKAERPRQNTQQHFFRNVQKTEQRNTKPQGGHEKSGELELDNAYHRQAHDIEELGKTSAEGSTKLSEKRISFLRQSDTLNPLGFTRRPSGSPPSVGRPGALTSTSLANTDHRNVTYVDLSAHTDAPRNPTAQGYSPSSTPAYEAGGPVNPAQLLLQTLDARPIAPGRPPSSVIARPSPVNPEVLLGSTEAPPVTLSFLNNRTDSKEGQRVPPEPINPSSVQISGAQAGQDLGPSPFFSGAPLRPQYVYTTQSPPRAPVDPASLLIAPGFTTRPPITIPPQGYNPLLENLQKLDIVHVNDEPIPGGVDIPSPQDVLSGLDTEFPFQEQPAFAQNDPHHSRPTEPQIPGISPPALSPEAPLVISNNTLVEGQGAAPILDLIDNNSAFDVLNQISSLSAGTAPAPQEAFAGSHELQSSPQTLQQQQQQSLYTTRPTQQVFPNKHVLNVPQPTNNGYFPQNLPYPNNFYDANLRPFLSNDAQMSQSLPGQVNFPPRYPNTYVNHPNIPVGYSNVRPGYPPPLNSHWPYGNHQLPGNGNLQVPNNGIPFPGSSDQFPYPYPFPYQANSDFASQGQSADETQPSASVAASVTNKVSSADSTAEGGDGVVSTSTTIVKGGSSTSNNNFYRPRPGGGQGTSAIVPAGSARPPGVEPVPASTSSSRPRPPIIVDGVHNKTATPSDVFPDSNVNVACSRRHGCPAFILRRRPSVPQPGDDRKFTYIFDEAVEKRPSGNINIACDIQDGCPTYIINTTPDPLRAALSTAATSSPTILPVTTAPPLPPLAAAQQAATPQPPLTTDVGEGELLEAIGLVLDLLNKTEGLDFEDNDTGLTGDFDYIFQGAGVEGFDSLLSHTPGLAPPINPQNIRPGLQIHPVAVPSTTLSPLAQHIGLQNRPNYDVVRVPENTALNTPSLSNLLDNKRVFSVNPIQTKTSQDTGSELLGQPGSFDLLRNKLVQAHLESLQENGLGVNSPDPLGSHVPEVGSLEDAHMGGAQSPGRPSLAALLNLEPQNIPDEPPLVPASEPADDHHHNMMRHIMAATFMGLPMTTALMTAMGAPVALLAPLGLAIPALLTMGFMDINSNQGHFGHHFRRPLHGHSHHAHGHHAHHHEEPQQASATEASDVSCLNMERGGMGGMGRHWESRSGFRTASLRYTSNFECHLDFTALLLSL